MRFHSSLTITAYAAMAAALALPLSDSVRITSRAPAFDGLPVSNGNAHNSEKELVEKRQGSPAPDGTADWSSDSSETFDCTYDCSGFAKNAVRERKRRDGSEDGSAWDN